MSGGFFRGTSAEQDTRFSNKQMKLLKTQKFASELEHLVDITKVKMDVIKPWIARRVTELIGIEDEVLINFIYTLLDEKEVNGKEIQIQLTGFMEKNTGKFMKELWALLLSAQKNASGVPQQFLDAKEEETRKKKEETDRIFNEIQRRKEKETKESELEKARKMDGGLDNNSAEESNRGAERGSDTHSGDANGAGVTNGFRGRKRSSKSPYSSDHSPSPRRGARSRSISKSFSSSRSYSKGRSISRSISGSPRARRISFSPERIRLSPRRRSVTPKRRSARESISPRRRFHSGRRSSSRTRHRSPSPLRRRVHSPVHRRRSPSPLRRRSPFYARRRSPSPRRWSRSPLRRRSPSPRRYRSPSPRPHRSRSPWRRQSPSPRRRRSPTLRRRQRSTSSSRSRSPIQRRPVSPARRRYQSPIRRRSPFPVRRRSPTPNRRSLSPWGRKSQSPGRSRSSSPVRRRSPIQARRRSPVPARRRSPVSSPSRSQSPASGSSASPIRHHSVSPVKMKSPRLQKSPHGPPRGKIRTHEPAKMDHRQPISLSPQRDHADRNSSRRKVPLISPTPEKSPSYSESPRTQTRMRLVSPYESPYKKDGDQRMLDDSQSPPAKLRDRKAHNSSPVRSDRGMQNSREDGENKSIGKGSVRSSGGKNKESPDRSSGRRLHDGSDFRKDNEIKSEEVYKKEARALKKSPHKGFLPEEMPDVTQTGNMSKSDEKRSSHSKDAKDNMRSDSLLDPRKKNEQRSPSFDSDSGAEGSDKQRAGVVEKRKHRRSSRREAASDDTSSDSETQDRKEAKRRRKEEKKLRKEERRRRREERRRRKEEKRASKRKRKSKDADLSSDMEKNEKSAYASKYSTDDEETESQKKRLEIELREKALESLRAKKGISR